MSRQQQQASSPMQRVENGEGSKWQRASQSRPVEEHSKARVYGYSNLYHSSSRVLNVMRKCQPTGKIQFLTRFAMICSSWGCTDAWCFNRMSEERTDYADLICATKPEKAQRELAFRWDMPPSPCHFFCFQTPSFECHWQRPSARLQLRSQQGGTTRCFTPPAEMTVVGEQNHLTRYLNGLTQHSDWTLMMLVSLLLYITPARKTSRVFLTWFWIIKILLWTYGLLRIL